MLFLGAKNRESAEDCLFGRRFSEAAVVKSSVESVCGEIIGRGVVDLDLEATAPSSGEHGREWQMRTTALLQKRGVIDVVGGGSGNGSATAALGQITVMDFVDEENVNHCPMGMK
ncbi:hypothetical protein LOK49_LG05G00680 [Camellia lanceoleosa]|uniref:Uncharacterized protein n=1 Tax=Camellia lanceoleosa TaxID=1840588 RepID=A0ACC0HS73_9ERIC|nr:hypothetical protein LOK49_LG05G00680 [Camellia lanceoleosa]